MVGWEGGNGERKGVVDGERRISLEKERENEGCLPGGKEGAREVDTNTSTKARTRRNDWDADGEKTWEKNTTTQHQVLNTDIETRTRATEELTKRGACNDEPQVNNLLDSS